MRLITHRLPSLFLVAIAAMANSACGKFFPGSNTAPSSSGGGSNGGTSGFVFVANSGSQNISAFSINATTGVLTAVSGSPFSATAGPNLLTIDPQNRFLFAGLSSAGVEVFSISGSGVLTQVTSGGSAASGTTPLALAVTPNASLLYVLDKISSTVSAFSVGSSGALTAAKGTALPTGSVPAANVPGQGLAIESMGTHLYAAIGSAGIFSGTINSDGSLTQTTTTVAPVGASLQQLVTTPSGSFLYALDPSNGVAAYSVGSAGLSLLNGGKTFTAGTSLTGLAVDAASKIVLVTSSSGNNVSSFTIKSDGTLAAVSGSPFPVGVFPEALTFENSDKFVYIAGTSGVTVFTLDTTTEGKLDQQSNVSTGTTPASIVASH